MVLFLLICFAGRAEFRPLFNEEGLTGWTAYVPSGTASAVGGELRTSGRGHVPNWIHIDAEFEDFALRFEYKLAQWVEAAVIVRAPQSDRP